MKPSGNLSRLSRPPRLTQARVLSALALAILADGLQLLLGPMGWAFSDQIIDFIMMLLASWLIGFHWLFLPSFILELVPLADEFPTWTACVIAVTILRRRQQRQSPPERSEGPVIDV